jgi:hypothetical protein
VSQSATKTRLLPYPTGDGDAQRLVDMHAEAVRCDKRSAENTTRETIERSLAAHKRHDVACEAFRRRYFPRAHRVVAVFGEVFTVSRTGRSIQLVWSELGR